MGYNIFDQKGLLLISADHSEGKSATEQYLGRDQWNEQVFDYLTGSVAGELTRRILPLPRDMSTHSVHGTGRGRQFVGEKTFVALYCAL